jgi:hypothetical protein
VQNIGGLEDFKKEIDFITGNTTDIPKKRFGLSLSVLTFIFSQMVPPRRPLRVTKAVLINHILTVSKIF